MALTGLLFVDVDGTLVGAGGVNPRVWPALAELRAAGWGVGLCTGRPGSGEALELARRADPDGLHVFESGAVVVDPAGAVVASAPLPAAAVPEVLALGREHGATLEGYTAGGRYLAHERNDHVRRHEALLAASAEVVASIADAPDLVRVQWVVPRVRWPGLRADAAALDSVVVHEGRSPKMPDVIFAAVVAAEVSKAWGVTRAAAGREVSLERVAMVGDGDNDVPVLGIVRWSFAPRNGVPSARATADRIVAGPDEGAVAEVVEALLTG